MYCKFVNTCTYGMQNHNPWMCKMTKPLHDNEQNEYSLYKAGHDCSSGVNKRQLAYVKYYL